MPKKWGASAKKLLTTKKGKEAKQHHRQPSSSSSEDDSSSSSSSDESYSSSASSSSQSHKSVDSSGAKVVKPIKLATLPNFDDDSSSGSSSESEFGCGTYRRREDLSVSSSAASSAKSSSGSDSDDDDDSQSSRSSSSGGSASSNSSHDSSYSSAEENESIPSLPAPRSPRAAVPSAPKSFSERFSTDAAKRKSAFGLIFNMKKTFGKKSLSKEKGSSGGDVLVPNQLEKCNPSTHSLGSRKSVGSSLPSKKESSSNNSSSEEDDEESRSESDDSSGGSSSSVKSEKKGEADKTKKKKGKTTKSDNSQPPKRVTVAKEEGKKEKGQSRRRSSVSSTSSDKDVKSSLAPSLYNEDQVNMVNRRRASLSSDNGDKGANSSPAKTANGPAKAIVTPQASKSAKSNWGKLAKAIKHEEESSTDVDDVFSNVLLLAKKKREEKRRQSDGSNENDDETTTNDDDQQSKKGNSSDLFQKVLQAAREEKRRQSMASTEENDEIDDNSKSKADKGGGSGANPRKGGRAKDGEESDSDEEFQAPKLVYQRKSMKDLFDNKIEDSASTGSEEGKQDQSLMNEQDLAPDESDEESSSSEASEERSLSTESSEEGEDFDPSDQMSSDDDDELSAESQMSILTPIAEAPELDDTDVECADTSSHSEESVSLKASEDDADESHDDQSVQGETEISTQSNVAEQEPNGAEAMLTDMPDETDTALAKRKAVQNIMKDKSLNAVERNKKIQDIMAGKVDLPKVSAKPREETPVTENPLNDSEPTGAEAMLTDMPDETDTALAKRKAVQNVMKDKSLNAVERNKKIQDIMAGRVELPTAPPKPSQDPMHTKNEAHEKEVDVSVAKNGKAKEPAKRRRRRKSVEKADPPKDVPAKAKPTINAISEDDKVSHEVSNGHTYTSNATLETFDSSCDELKETNLPDAPCREKSESQTQSSLLEIETDNDLSNEQKSKNAFQEAMSSAETSADKSPDDRGLLTSLTYALYNLDSKWALDSFSNAQRTQSISILCSLGKRERISPWSNHMVNQNKINMLNSFFGDISKAVREKTGVSDLRNSSIDSSDSSPTGRQMPSYKSERRMSWVKDLESVVKEPRKPSRELTAASFDMKQSAVIAKISENLLLEPFSDNDDSDHFECLDDSYQSRVAKRDTKIMKWAKSLIKLDPRSQIRQFCEDVSTSLDAEIFTVWRPTSFDAIAKMMRREGVGKGLEVKGKSAQCGVLSGYVPFLQIHENEHKSMIRVLKSDRTKIFFKTVAARNAVGKLLGQTSKEMTLRVTKAKFALARMDENNDNSNEEAWISEIDRYEVDNAAITLNDNYAPDRYGIEVSCRVLWEALVVDYDISRTSNMITGRASQPPFQDMNFATLRKQYKNSAIPVLYQFSDTDPFDPRMLIIAYEEEGNVTPVVSDFDCFLIGSRNFFFEEEMAEDQIELLDWCISQIEWILDNQTDHPDSWTVKWLKILKHAAMNGFVPKMPPFGFGDPASYGIIEAAVNKSKKTNGAVRHGPECFNFFFPQDLDSELLIIYPGNQKWKYVSIPELQQILIEKIREGFTVPLNPKWILCDPGWINVFIELLKSRRPSVQSSMNIWFPAKSGLRERIISISKKHPNGFRSSPKCDNNMSLAVQEYERFLVLQRARRKLKGFFVMKNMHSAAKKRMEDQERERVLAVKNIVSAKNAARFLRRKSILRIENETLDSIQNAVLFDGDESSHKKDHIED